MNYPRPIYWYKTCLAFQDGVRDATVFAFHDCDQAPLRASNCEARAPPEDTYFSSGY